MKLNKGACSISSTALSRYDGESLMAEIAGMLIRILDLDGAYRDQPELRNRCALLMDSLPEWGPRIRLACSFRRFRRFERALADLPGRSSAGEPALTFYGSGDFHHVSLALLRRFKEPFNLLVLDKHPDWMRGVPLLHCGTWLYHAARLPNVERIFHAGGDLDFDNSFRWLAPWSMLESGKITVFPALRRFQRGRWSKIANEPLRPEPRTLVSTERIEELLRPHHAELSRRPLYVSLDKDVLTTDDAVVNWDSGYLVLAEAQTILSAFLRAAAGRLIGMDILGDWSPVRVQGLPRRFLHVTEHPALAVAPLSAARRNERTNLALLETVKPM